MYSQCHYLGLCLHYLNPPFHTLAHCMLIPIINKDYELATYHKWHYRGIGTLTWMPLIQLDFVFSSNKQIGKESENNKKFDILKIALYLCVC